VIDVRFDAWRILDEKLFRRPDRHPRIHRPRARENFRIFDRRLIPERVTDARQALDDVQIVAVEPTVDPKPLGIRYRVFGSTVYCLLSASFVVRH